METLVKTKIFIQEPNNSNFKLSPPKWHDIYLKFLTKEQLYLLYDYCYKFKSVNGYYCFLIGLMHEYEVFGELKKESAPKWYRRGMILRDPYSFIRNYFIHRLDYDQFDVDPNYDEAIFSLIMACAYCHELTYKDDCLLKHDASIIELLTNHINYEDQQKCKYQKLIEAYYFKNPEDMEYVINWMHIKFAHTEKAIKAFDAQKKLAETGHYDASYHVGISYYAGLSFMTKSFSDAEKWLLLGVNSNRARNFEALATLYERRREVELFFNYLQKAYERGSVECLWKLAYFYGSGVGAPSDKKLAFAFAKKSYLVSDSPYSTYAMSYLLKHVLSYMEVEHQRVAHSLLYQIGEKNYYFIDYALNYAIQPLAICYEYGLGCKIDLQKAVDLHVEHINRCEEGWKRYSLYRLGVLYEKIGKYSEGMSYYQQSLKIYSGDWPSFHYRKGKMYEKGQGVKEKDVVKAMEHYKMGMELNVEFTLQLLFKKKCELAHHKMMAKRMLEENRED